MSEKTEPTICISLTVKNTAEALEFYARAFNAKELFRMPLPDGGVGHAEFMIGNTRVCISDESEEWHAYAMPDGMAAPCLFAIQVDNCDQAFEQAVTAGAKTLNEPIDYFWGMRSAMVNDPYGYRWALGQRVEEVSPEEMMKRAKDLFGG